MNIHDATETAYRNGYADGLAQRWISVDERLPENGKRVLVTTDKGNPFVARYDHKWARWRVSGTTDVTHWMPLPKPPEEGK